MCVAVINVTDEDILNDKASPNQRSRNCGIFYAAKRVFPSLTHVAPTAIVLEGGIRIPLPEIAKRYVRMSDTQAAVARGTLKDDPNDVDMETLKPITFQVQYENLNHSNRLVS